MKSFDDLVLICPVIDENRIKYLLNHLQYHIHETGSNHLPAELALVYAAQAHTFRSNGQIEVGDVLYQKCRETLVPVFDQVETNFLVAACYASIASYQLTYHDYQKAKFFISNGLSYFGNIPPDKLANKEKVVLYTLLFQQVSLNTQDVCKLFDLLIYYCKMHGYTGEVDPMNADDVRHLLVYLGENIKANIEQPDRTTQVMLLYLNSIGYGSLIKRNSEVEEPDYTTLRAITDDFVKLLNHPFFPQVNGMIGISIMAAANVYISIMKRSPSSEIMMQLRTCFDLLLQIITRNETMKPKYAEGMCEIENFISVYDNVCKSVGDLSFMPSCGGIVLL
ncbi:1 TM domain-containing transmembrane protein [Acrasis kona]|uniref:1 TM domain-containing transmembrane protein n=1 Tax=Acrasis kona TaxID=1008807 RepID=A0AAW2Z9I7_9EUKA